MSRNRPYHSVSRAAGQYARCPAANGYSAIERLEAPHTQYKPASRSFLHLRFRPCVHPEVGLDAAVPGFVVTGVQVDPLFIGHLLAPLKQGDGIGSDGVTQLPRSALYDFKDLLCHHRHRVRILPQRSCHHAQPVAVSGAGRNSEAGETSDHGFANGR